MKALSLRAIAALLCLPFLFGCSSLSSNIVSDPAGVVESRAALPELVDGLVVPLISSQKNVGIVVGVLDATGQQHVYGYGRKSLNSDEVPDGDTLFAIGSLTKSFTDVLLDQLIKSGEMRADDSVGAILPNETELSEASKHITVEQLANHISGLPRQPNDLEMVGSLIHYSFTGDDIYRHLDQRKIYNFLKDFHPSASDIGEYRYSNIGMGLLGHLIEIKQKKSLEDLFAARLFRPLGLRDTSYVVSYDQHLRLADGYVGDSPFFVAHNTPIPAWHMDEILKGAAGLYSTANDLLKWLRYRMSMTDVPVISAPVNSILDFGVADKKYQKLSLGWSVDDFDQDHIHIIYQHGMIAGYSAYMGFVPEKNIAVVVLYNNFYWDDRIGHNILLSLSWRSETGDVK